MSTLLASMVVVASGTPGRVARWAGRLSDASIPFHVTSPCREEGDGRASHFEVWVQPDHADEARSVLRAASRDEKSLLW